MTDWCQPAVGGLVSSGAGAAAAASASSAIDHHCPQVDLLKKPASFQGRSSLRTYATGILKFKIVDALRQRGREVHVEVLAEQNLDEALDALFRKDGHWQDPPASWQQPEKALEQAQFFEILQDCVDRLPAKLARIFMMREWLEQDTETICRELGITANHCGVMLYRARMQLRECLEQRWFAETPRRRRGLEGATLMTAKLGCQQVSRLVSAGLDQGLPAEEQARLRLHLAIRQPCRDVDQQFGLLHRAMRQLGQDGELPAPAATRPAER